MDYVVKNTFVLVEDPSAIETKRRNSRRQTLPKEWKPPLCFNNVPSSDASTEYSPRSSPRSSLSSSLEDESSVASLLSHGLACQCPSSRIDKKTDAVVAALHSFFVAYLPADSVHIERGTIEEGAVEQSRKVTICVDAQDGTLVAHQSYRLMQGLKQHLSNIVMHSEGLGLLSARVQKEDNGYILRSSVSCVPEDKANHMCWNVLRKGSCRHKFCQWYHPQSCDIVKFKVFIRCQGAKAK